MGRVRVRARVSVSVWVCEYMYLEDGVYKIV